jgi:hypothetical protein
MTMRDLVPPRRRRHRERPAHRGGDRPPAGVAGRGRHRQHIRVALDSTYLFDRETGRAYARVPGVQTAASGAPDVLLEPYDNVLILRQPDFELQRTVFLGGEVRYPGRYALRRKTERLNEVIARAGGLTSEGYADGVVFFRTRDNTGRVGIDLPRVLRDSRTRDNFILRTATRWWCRRTIRWCASRARSTRRARWRSAPGRTSTTS